LALCAEIQAALGLNRPSLIGWPDASGNCFLGPDYISIRQRSIGRARKCSCKFFGYDPAATRNAPKQSVSSATGRQARPPGLETFAAAFALAGEKQEMAADQGTLALLKHFSHDPGVAKATAEFEHAQRAEETFHKDLDGLDLTMSVTRIRTIASPASFPVATIQK
jgi:hypothetical protein